MHTPAIPGKRATRIVSFEQEVSEPEDARTAAEALHAAGYSGFDYVAGYSEGSRNGRNGRQFVVVKEDGSCGGEIVYSRMDLSRRDHARSFGDALRVAAETGIETSTNTGGHIHVDAHGLVMTDVLSLYVLWNYIEDVVFRLAATGADGDHRTRGSEGSYAPPTPKGLTGLGIPAGMSGNRFALNVTNYLSAQGNCACGAYRYGMMSLCTCRLPKNTVEFRVWDSSTDARRIRTWVALSIAMVEYARGRNLSATRLPALAYDGSRYVNNRRTNKVANRLRFLLERLPLTERDRSDVAYLIADNAPSLQPILTLVAPDLSGEAIVPPDDSDAVPDPPEVDETPQDVYVCPPGTRFTGGTAVDEQNAPLYEANADGRSGRRVLEEGGRHAQLVVSHPREYVIGVMSGVPWEPSMRDACTRETLVHLLEEENARYAAASNDQPMVAVYDNPAYDSLTSDDDERPF